MLLDLVNRVSSERKVKKILDIQVWILWRSSRGRPENVLGTSRINLPGTSLELQIKTSLDVISGRPQDVSLGRPWDFKLGLPLDGQVGPLVDVLGTFDGDVFSTSWGPIFAGWVSSIYQTWSARIQFCRIRWKYIVNNLIHVVMKVSRIADVSAFEWKTLRKVMMRLQK